MATAWQNSTQSLLIKLRSIIYDMLQTFKQFIEPLQNGSKLASQKLTFVRLFRRIIGHLYRLWMRCFRALYWMLAPNVLFNLTVRHGLLFAIMLASPSVIRCTVSPLLKWLRYSVFLRMVMGQEWVDKYKQLKRQSMAPGINYTQYAQHAAKMDDMDGLFAWRMNNNSPLYSHQRLQSDLRQLNDHVSAIQKFSSDRNHHRNHGVQQESVVHPMRELMEFLRSRIERNYCGIANAKLYSVAKIGTKKLIEDYVQRTCECLTYIANHEHDATISVGERIVFFNEIRHVLGRTALCLSGGGGLGAYHIGVVLSMAQNGLLPKLITGSSVGSVVASLVCTRRETELIALLKNENLNLTYFEQTKNRSWINALYIRLRRFWNTGFFLDIGILRDCVRDNIGDTTFLEAYQQTGRILNITVSPTDANAMPRLLNFLNAPNVVVWSAVAASCAIPFVFEPQELYMKNPRTHLIESVYLEGVQFADGSVSHDLPMNRLQTLFNVDNFIVSQVNPHLVPFLFHSIVAPIPLFERLFRFLGNEFRLYTIAVLVNLRELGLLKGLGLLNNLFTQKYTGDVTIVPDAQLSDFSAILQNPSFNTIKRCTNTSQQSTFRHISRLQGLCAVEFTIDECLRALRSQLVMERTATFDEKLHRISSFQAPTQDNKYETVRGNPLHIEQAIFDSILHNTQVPERNVQEMPTVHQSDNFSDTDADLYDTLAGTATHPSEGQLSVAELCNDYSNVV